MSPVFEFVSFHLARSHGQVGGHPLKRLDAGHFVNRYRAHRPRIFQRPTVNRADIGAFGLEIRIRFGRQPRARQMGLEVGSFLKSAPHGGGERRSTRPRFTASRARSLALQWLSGRPQSLGGLQARAMIAHTSSAAIRSGPPQRGASRKRSATVPRTPAPESHRARQALTVLRQIPSLSAVPSIPRPSPKSNTMRARIASCCGVKDARIRRSSPSRSSSLNSILAALRPISSLHREIIATENQTTENQTTENKSLICESELTPTCTR